MTPKTGDIIVVWFSCGLASAVAGKLILDRYKQECNIKILNNPILEEHSDNRRFMKDVEQWYQHPIETCISQKFPNHCAKEVWEKRGVMSTIYGAPCTNELKRVARQEWEKLNHFDWIVLGFTSEEKKRAENFKLTERSNLLTILIDNNISKQQCFDIVTQAGIAPPHVYSLGYPNANCLGCVKATSPTYWNKIRQDFPEVFSERAEQSRTLGAKLVRVKGKRIFLDELDPKAKGRDLKHLQTGECGIFCEEKN